MTPIRRASTASLSVLEISAHTTTHPAQRYVIRRLRGLVPHHDDVMNWPEAERIAAAQAALTCRLAARAGIDPVKFVSTLPVVRVVNDPHLPETRTSYWDDHSQQWIILIRATEALEHRRFGIMCEFKRILDRGREPELYDARFLYGHVQAEMAADHFASNVLMPAQPVRKAVRDGATLRDLAHQFRVTPRRAGKRLSDLNLLPIIERPKGGIHDPHTNEERPRRAGR